MTKPPGRPKPKVKKKASAKRIAEGFCPARADETHCVHWWESDAPCCDCKDNTPEKP